MNKLILLVIFSWIKIEHTHCLVYSMLLISWYNIHTILHDEVKWLFSVDQPYTEKITGLGEVFFLADSMKTSRSAMQYKQTAH